MPGIVKVRVIAGKDLPVMDRASDLTDAFVEVRLGNATVKTDVCRKTLFPHWNSEWFRFELDDEELQEEPLQIKVLDHDSYSAHDVIGKVNISLAPLLLRDGASEIAGWFPIYDTLHGIRGYVNVKVRLDFFVDTNKYHQGSCRVKFFSTSGVPFGFKVVAVQGFVDVLLVNDDPEYQWIDKIRTPRASNEARLRLFAKLSGEVHRKIGLKVSEANGNAVIGYHQSFDIEGESGIVVRGIGTAVTLIKEELLANQFEQPSPDGIPPFESINENAVLQTTGDSQPTQTWLLTSGKYLSYQFLRNRTISSSSDGADSIDNAVVASIAVDSPENHLIEKTHGGRHGMHNLTKRSIDDMEFPFFTVMHCPPNFILHLGQIVSARSVKLLDKVNNTDFSKTRSTWWNEVRNEVKLHAKALGCNAVIGYSEVTTICEDLIVLSAVGTAAIVVLPELSGNDLHHSLQGIEKLSDQPPETPGGRERKDTANDEQNTEWTTQDGTVPNGVCAPASGCSLCHVPYVDTDLPISVTLAKCRVCRQGKVPDVLFTTIEVPEDIPQTGIGCFLQARVCRQKKKEKGDALAENVSQILPFLEFELHQQLMNKLKIKGMNALFAWKSQISVGDQFIVGIVSATAVYLTALASPPIFIVAAGKHNSSEEEKQLMEIQKKIIDVTSKNRKNLNLVDTLELPSTPPNTPINQSYNASVMAFEGDCDPRGHLDLGCGVKEAYILEMDDKKDDELGQLLDSGLDHGAPLFSTQGTPGFLPICSEYQFLTVFQQIKFNEEDIRNNTRFSAVCDDILKGLQFKVRSLRPCCVSKINFDVEIPEDDFLQVTVTAAAFTVAEESISLQKGGKQGILRGSYDLGDDLVFQMDVIENQHEKHPEKPHSQPVQTKRQQSAQAERRSQLAAPLNRPSVMVTSLPWLPNHKVIQYLGNLNLFFIRESTSIKEDGGSNMFMQCFISEVHSILKAHVIALGGNAVLGFNLNEIILLDSPHKNQAQCLLNVSGDAAELQVTGENDLNPAFFSPNRRVSSSSGDSLIATSICIENRDILKEKASSNVETEV